MSDARVKPDDPAGAGERGAAGGGLTATADDAAVLARLRRFLLATAALLFAGTVAELVLVEHTEDAAQWVPFALCGLGFASAAAAFFRPRRVVLWALRAAALLAAGGSLYGVYEHVAGNLALLREVYPTATGGEVLWGALDGGNPLLAPGVLTLAAALALAATYRHPGMRN